MAFDLDDDELKATRKMKNLDNRMCDNQNSIEETIKQLKLILKIRNEQKEIIKCAGGSCINCDPDIKALSESINILSDYKRLQEEFKQVDNECKRLEQKELNLEKENKELKQDISRMYYEEVVINIMCDKFNISRSEALELLEGEEINERGRKESY